MKKLLAATLALLMVLSCMVVTVAADESNMNIATWSNCDDTAGWRGSNAAIDTEDKIEGSGAVSFTFKGNLATAGAFMIRYIPSEANAPALNIKGMRYMMFDLYVSNASAFTDANLCLELTSSGSNDKEENQWITPMTSYVEGELKDGWNQAVIDLQKLSKATGPDTVPLNTEALNYMRLFNVGAVNAGEGLTVKLDNVRFWDGVDPDYVPEDDGYDHEIYEFVPFEEEEAKYLIHRTSGKNDQKYFADKTTDITYKYTIKNGKLAEKVTWTGMVGSQLLLLVSMDGENWSEVYRWDGELKADGSGGMAADTITYDLTEFLDFSKSNDIYVRIADSYPDTGWGGNLYTGVPVVLDVMMPRLSDAEKDAVEAAADDRSISLMTCSEGFGAFRVDKENKVAGASSLMMDVGTGQVCSTAFNAVDATGYDALEFELYLSDTDFFNKTFADHQIELSSSGTYDKREIGWKFSDVLAGIEGAPVVGWNHVTLYFPDLSTVDFDVANVNFFRFYMIGAAEDVGVTLGLDNIRLTKAGTERNAAIEAENKAAAQKVVDRIDKLGEIDLDSVNAIERAEKEYKELTAAQKALVTNYDVLTAARAKYDELKAAADAEANKPADEDTKPEDEIKPEDETKPEDGTQNTEDIKTEVPAQESGSMTVIIIIVVVALVAAVAIALVIVFAKKKKK